jgi:hypothetical protein
VPAKNLLPPLERLPHGDLLGLPIGLERTVSGSFLLQRTSASTCDAPGSACCVDVDTAATATFPRIPRRRLERPASSADYTSACHRRTTAARYGDGALVAWPHTFIRSSTPSVVMPVTPRLFRTPATARPPNGVARLLGPPAFERAPYRLASDGRAGSPGFT